MNKDLFEKLNKEDWVLTKDARKYFNSELLNYLDSKAYQLKFEKIINQKYGPFESMRSSNIHTPIFNVRGQEKIEYLADFFIHADYKSGAGETFKIDYKYIHLHSGEIYESGSIKKSIGSFYIQKPKDSTDEFSGDYMCDKGMPRHAVSKNTVCSHIRKDE